jgi:hypothetical protein
MNGKKSVFRLKISAWYLQPLVHGKRQRVVGAAWIPWLATDKALIGGYVSVQSLLTSVFQTLLS